MRLNDCFTPLIHRSRTLQMLASGFLPHTVSVTNVLPVLQIDDRTTDTLLVDTGSSNTWIGADNPYKKTNTSVCTTKTFSVNYGSGFASGIYCELFAVFSYFRDIDS